MEDNDYTLGDKLRRKPEKDYPHVSRVQWWEQKVMEAQMTPRYLLEL